jgi:long-chain acyl-CoA synthetase
MPDGWFRTGDVASVDGFGCFSLQGRKKDVIDVLGMKFFPVEVESVLMSHPSVESASVYSLPDSRVGAIILARVVLGDGAGKIPSETELMEHCKRHLAAFKVPQQIEFVAEIPRTASGKTLRRDVLHRGNTS